jgi:hypothetical protein
VRTTDEEGKKEVFISAHAFPTFQSGDELLKENADVTQLPQLAILTQREPRNPNRPISARKQRLQTNWILEGMYRLTKDSDRAKVSV